MKKAQVEIGKVYLMKVSGRLVPVRIGGPSGFGGWHGGAWGALITHAGSGGSKFLGIDMNLDQLKELKYVRGMENPSECLQNVCRWMIKHGYSDEEIGKCS